jgi:hypothetical protein
MEYKKVQELSVNHSQSEKTTMTKYLKAFVMSIMLLWTLGLGASKAYADGERITGTINRINKNVNGPLGQLYELDFILVGDNRMFATRQYANWENNLMVFSQHGDRVTFEVAYTSCNGFVVVRDFQYAPDPPPVQYAPVSATVGKTKASPPKKKAGPTTKRYAK